MVGGDPLTSVAQGVLGQWFVDPFTAGARGSDAELQERAAASAGVRADEVAGRRCCARPATQAVGACPLLPDRICTGPFRSWGKRWRESVIVLLAVLVASFAGGCAAAVRVHRAELRSVHRELTRSVLTTGEISEHSHNVLHRHGVAEAF